MLLLFVIVAMAAPAAVEAQQRFTEWVEMADGVLLATDVRLPAGDGPWPVVLLRTPYRRNGDIDSDFPAVELGYAFVVQEVRGTGESQGEYGVAEDDGPDGRVTIGWITDQWWCADGRIGMIGYSAAGAAQYAAAPGAPLTLDALSPGANSPDQFHHLIYQGGCLREELVVGVLDGLPDLLQAVREHRLKDAYWDPWDWIAAPEIVTTPALHFGGWFDFAQQGALDAFTTFQHQGGAGAFGNQYLVVGPWSHNTRGTWSDGARWYPRNAVMSIHDMYRDWLGWRLRGEATGAEQWPAVRVYLMGPGAEEAGVGNIWVGLPDWPPPAELVPLHLTAEGGLTGEVAPAGSTVLTIDPEYPVPTYGGANGFLFSGSADQRNVESRSDVLSFTSDVLSRPLVVMGRLTARIWIVPDTLDLDLSVRLTDVYPDGRSLLIADGIQRARMRCGDDVECLLEPGVPTEIEVDLWSTAMVFDAGHRIRMALAGTNFSRFEVNPCDGGDLNHGIPAVAHPEILFGPDHPSAILLPTVALGPRRPLGRWGAPVP
jgi:predicted acyl esterase